MSEDLDKESAGKASASFGFASVAKGAKQGLVNEVFARVARNYDLMNDLMSGGLHRLWKSDFVSWLAPPKSGVRYVLLDVAGGTGDIARKVLEASGHGARAVICDISAEMMEAGRARAAGVGDRLAFVQGNAEALPFCDRSFDAYTIAFGMRNLTRMEAGIAEAYRVLKPGGRFLCLEFSSVEVPLLDTLYDAYSFNAIPGARRACRRRQRLLSLSCREHPPVSRSEILHAADRECRLRTRALPQSHRRHRRHPLRLATVMRH